jgi:hypothetical protein
LSHSGSGRTLNRHVRARKADAKMVPGARPLAWSEVGGPIIGDTQGDPVQKSAI